MTATAADRNLLFGLLALQNGLIDQGALFSAFTAWARDKARPLADHLVERGELDAAGCAVVEALAALHIKKHGGAAEKSLAAIHTPRSTRESLVRIGDPDLDGTLARVGPGSTQAAEVESDRTATYTVGSSTSDGQRFRILRPHARGGLGVIFVALDTELRREVALKQILDQHADDPTSRARFLLEAEVTGGLEHPGIVPVYGLGAYANGRPYYAMRLIRGETLKQAIEGYHGEPGRASAGNIKETRGAHVTPLASDATPLAFRKLLRHFLDACNAIEYAHSRGVLHRDIKPGNIIVGRHGETLVVDWGLAKVVRKDEGGRTKDEKDQDAAVLSSSLIPHPSSLPSETLPGSALGTPAYMSPEQAAGNHQAVSPRSDVYSLGATLYCLLTGGPPFVGDDVGALLRAVQRGGFAAPRQVAPSLERALEAVCLKAMALRPEDRYDSCRALAEDIERWMADEPVTAWREPALERARRWARRNRTAVASVVVALLAGVIGLAATAGVQARANGLLGRAYAATNQALNDTRKAQGETQNALRASEESRKQAEAISQFLVEALSSADPSRDGRDVKVADILDRARARLDKDFTGSPATKGALLETLGRTYRGLGFFDRAVSSLTKAVAVLEATLGADHPSTLTSRSALAMAYRSAGRLSDALALDEETLKLREANLGPAHTDTQSSRHGLANTYFAVGRLAESIALNESNLKYRESTLGPDHLRTLSTRNNLAVAYLFAGRLPEAIALGERTLELEESKLGPDHPDTLNTRSNLALAYRRSGRTFDAIAMDEQTLRLRENKLGPDHRDTLITQDNLGLAYRDAGRTSEAVALHRAALKGLEPTLGPDHPDTLLCRHNLAVSLRDQGRLSEAIALDRATLKQMELRLGPSHSSTLETRLQVALDDEQLGRTQEAEAELRGVVARRRQVVKATSPILAADLAHLAANLLHQSRWTESESLLREGLAIREKSAPDHWSRYDMMTRLGESLLGQSRYAEAERLIVPGYEGIKARAETIAPADRSHRLNEAALRVVWLYEEWGKPDQATAWKAKLGIPDLPTTVFAPP
jgi:serine/threonine protein kinase/tetratricopeptide (TPR) repeat protein